MILFGVVMTVKVKMYLCAISNMSHLGNVGGYAVNCHLLGIIGTVFYVAMGTHQQACTCCWIPLAVSYHNGLVRTNIRTWKGRYRAGQGGWVIDAW